jgi:hypothetical protein
MKKSKLSHKVSLVSVSPHDDGGKLLTKDIKNLENIGIETRIITGNKRPLSVVYNEVIINIEDSVDYLILCHDDITVFPYSEDFQKSIDIMKDGNFALGGLAGTKECVIKEKNLWHLMNNVKPFYNASGEVRHYTNKQYDHYFNSKFGTYPERVILLDGVFLWLDIKKIKEHNILFDESCPAPFHFYDLDFCLTINKNHLKMTTLPVKIVHASHGLSDIQNEDWNKGNEWFKQKWSN